MASKAEMGDLVCWVSTGGFFEFGTVAGFMKSGHPMVRRFGIDSWTKKPYRVHQCGYSWMVIAKKGDRSEELSLDRKIWDAVEEWMKN